MRHKDCNRDREIDMKMLKLTDLTALLTDKQTKTKALPSQSAPIKDVSKFSDPIVQEKNNDASKAVSLETGKKTTKEKSHSTERLKKGGISMKPATFDGTSSWIDYKSNFDMCADING